jgi:hypothetical protein
MSPSLATSSNDDDKSRQRNAIKRIELLLRPSSPHGRILHRPAITRGHLHHEVTLLCLSPQRNMWRRPPGHWHVPYSVGTPAGPTESVALARLDKRLVYLVLWLALPAEPNLHHEGFTPRRAVDSLLLLLTNLTLCSRYAK